MSFIKLTRSHSKKPITINVKQLAMYEPKDKGFEGSLVYVSGQPAVAVEQTPEQIDALIAKAIA